MTEEINISISEDPEIRSLEEKKVYNTIYTNRNDESLIQKSKEFYKTSDKGTKNVIMLSLIGISVITFITLCFYIIKHIYVS